MDYQLELKQIVDFPRCRIYREFIQTLATPANPSIHIANYAKYFNKIKQDFNSRTVTNPKKLKGIKLSKSMNNTIELDLWCKNKLCPGRELLGIRRVSEALADIDSRFIIGKSHVLVSA